MKYRWFPAITGIFVTSLVISNIIAVKLAIIGPFVLPAAIIIFPISYIFGDILTGVYGYSRARQVIWIGFACNVFAVAAIWVAGRIPAASFWTVAGFESAETSQLAFDAILGFTPRLLGASFSAYLLGEFINSFVLARLKVATQGHHLWVRTIASTLIGQLADSGVFIFLAFVGIVPGPVLGELIITQWLFKSAYEAIATPITYLIVNYLKRTEAVDFFDSETNFNPVALKG